MDERISAEDLYSISRHEIEAAIADYEREATPHDFSDSTSYDLLIGGHRRYPPKAIVGLAARPHFGRVLRNAE